MELLTTLAGDEPGVVMRILMRESYILFSLRRSKRKENKGSGKDLSIGGKRKRNRSGTGQTHYLFIIL